MDNKKEAREPWAAGFFANFSYLPEKTGLMSFKRPVQLRCNKVNCAAVSANPNRPEHRRGRSVKSTPHQRTRLPGPNRQSRLPAPDLPWRQLQPPPKKNRLWKTRACSTTTQQLLLPCHQRNPGVGLLSHQIDEIGSCHWSHVAHGFDVANTD